MAKMLPENHYFYKIGHRIAPDHHRIKIKAILKNLDMYEYDENLKKYFCYAFGGIILPPI